MTKIAVLIDFLISNTPIAIKSKAKSYQPKLVKASNGKFLYTVGDYIVRIKIPTINKKLLTKLTEKQIVKLRNIKNRNILVSCTCNYWKWNGPDYNAISKGYSERSFSDLSEPEIRDPEHKNLICKHTYAALKSIKKDNPIID
jgi:hypothetical protein